MRMSPADHRNNLTTFIASLNQRTETPVRDFPLREFTSDAALYTEIDFLRILESGTAGSNLFTLMNCHMQLFKSILHVALKEIDGRSYLERLLTHGNSEIRFLGLKLTTALLTRLLSTSSDELILRSVFQPAGSLTLEASANQAATAASQLGLLLRLSLIDSDERVSGFATELAYSIIATTRGELELAQRQIANACLAEFSEQIPPRDASTPHAPIARVIPEHALLDPNMMFSAWRYGELSTTQIGYIQDRRDELYRAVFELDGLEEETDSRMSLT